MSASLTDAIDHIVFQTVMLPRRERRQKQEYYVLEGKHQKDPVSVEFEVRIKSGFVKKKALDLIKDDHVILQKQRDTMFFLFQAPKDAFEKCKDGSIRFREDRKTPNYTYTISFHRGIKKADQKEQISPKELIKQGHVTEGVNALLQEYGLNVKAEEASVASEYMKKWQLEHPDEPLIEDE